MTDSERLYVHSLEQQLQSLKELNELQAKQIERLTELLLSSGII